MQRTTSQIIAGSTIAFGTSGARGLVVDFKDEVCGAFAQAFIEVMQQSFSFQRLAIGIDNRPSSEAMAAACAGMAKACGIAVDYYGVLPTPALAFKAMQDKVPAIMVTGSHIPFDRNGLKFYRPDGEINKADEQAILNSTSCALSFSAELPVYNPTGVAAYVQRYLDVFPADCLQGKHIGIYEHSSAGRDIYARVFTALGAEVRSLERTEHFVPIDTEAVTEQDKLKAKIWVEQYEFDAIFSTDGDGDRPLIADEKGEWLRGDIAGLLCAKALGIASLAVPVSCNTAIEACGSFEQVVRTKIGSPYVIAAFSELAVTGFSYAGFEANGGFLLGSDILVYEKNLRALPTRDALLPALALFSAAGNQPLSALADALPSRVTSSDRIQQVPTQWSQTFLANALGDIEATLVGLGLDNKEIKTVCQIDGLRMTFNDGDIVHLRPSGNAPELRCYVEAGSRHGAVILLKQVIGSLLKLVSK